MEYWLGWFHEGNEQLKAVARAAEAMGFAGMALPDHIALPVDYTAVHPSGRRHIEAHTPFPDALISAATILAVTERLRVMTYVYVLPMREPFSVAKQVATLAMQSGNRFAFGAGAGWNTDEIALLGHDPATRGARMDEMLAIMQDFWEDGVAEFHGRHYDFAPAGERPVPERHIPVWIGGKSPAALRRAARHDGWLGMSYPMEEIATLLPQLRAERARHLAAGGIDRGDFRTFVIPQETPSEAVYGQLAAWGIDGTVALPWGVENPACESLEAKLAAMQTFADRYF